ncbi:MAG: aspartate aminotransferase family protein [Deltaproteobacteria bacterium]|jgi:4-aminobutyrate aminotransferase|nr:aspartate aminotransferase family protein [Deltaproteobacteria bacterium]MBW2517372.1 aspartate aminotransferase family protein [Deltaproteobacteria bacterium]
MPVYNAHKQPLVDLSEGDSNLSPHRRQWIETAVDPDSQRWLERDAAVFLHQSLSTPCMNVLKSCQGPFIKDLQGRRYFDFHGNSAHQVGFAHPRVIAAIKDQLDTMAFCTRRYTNIAAIELAEKLAAIAPEPLGKVLFAPGGSTAVGMAMKLARAATGRFKTISMWDAFHGASLDAMSISGETMFRQDVGPLLTGTQHVPPAEPYRCIWQPGGECVSCDLRCAAYIDYVLEKEGDVGAVIAEPVRNTAVNPPPPGYWQAVRKACDRHGTLLVLDETAVCLGRTGSMFACQTFDVIPDILTIGKGIGGGVIPFAVMIARSDLDVAPEKGIGHYTHEKNPVAAAAGLATIDIIESQNLPQRATEMGGYALKRLQNMQNDHPLIGDVRGVGLVLGIDLVKDRGSKERAVAEADRLMYACLHRGLSFKTSQGSFIPLSPPLTITRQELDDALDILESALTVVERGI